MLFLWDEFCWRIKKLQKGDWYHDFTEKEQVRGIILLNLSLLIRIGDFTVVNSDASFID